MSRTNYKELIGEVSELIRGIDHPIANYANVSAAIWQAMDDINWAGFYLLEGNTLILGPFQGHPACVYIPEGKGVCGMAVKQKRTLIVPDVHAFPGHITCDSASRSEIVVPVIKNEKVLGVLDIDSPLHDRFDHEDKDQLEQLVSILIDSFD